MATSPVFMAMTGWLCVQHRGGPKAFVRVLDEHTLGSADHRGNTQFIALTG
jgi:predicted pyridoxine 5'-phosphate oxidase superfamily flavin-nucleotide-binding protein